jgi:two-component system, cell cycle sensor histidine kinase and response regulator CckA
VQCSLASPKKARLLCVDDDPQFLVLLTAVLEAAGYSVVATNDPGDALDLGICRPFDLVIADYEMPHMNGGELACRIKQHKCHLPIILFGTPSLPSGILSIVDDHVFKGDGVELLLQKLSARIQW